MGKKKYASVVALGAAEQRVQSDLVFSVTCKNDGKRKTFDFSKKAYAESSRQILEIFVWALFKLRYLQGNNTRTAIYDSSNRFFEFLEGHSVYHPEQLNSALLSRFSEWLKIYTSISYSTAASRYRSLRSVFLQMNNHPKVVGEFIPPRNAFPKSTSLQSPNIGYDKKELKQIFKAVVQELRGQKDRFENPYKPRYIGEPPPMDGVAELNPRTGRRALWASREHLIWYFENILNCQRILTYTEIIQYPKGYMFWYGVQRDYSTDEYSSVQEFYDCIGADSNYIPKYLGQPTPIKYLTPWKNKEYVIWYWENFMEATAYTDEMLKRKYPEFRTAMRENWSGYGEFFREMKVWYWISAYDLAPYYLMLLLRTGLNPSTIQRLTVDCIKPDPIDPERKYIDWTKYRSSKKGKTIPEQESENDTWAISIIERVIKITEKIRQKGQAELWISNANPQKEPKTFGSGYFHSGVKKIFDRHPIKASGTGDRLWVQAQQIRPTLAWNEYLRTEDLRYLQSLLGHAAPSTTAEYLRRVEDPLFRSRRAIHQEAMLLGLTEGGSVSEDYLKANGSRVIAKDTANGIHDGLLNHCKNPFDAQIPGQRQGEFCDADVEVCQGCQNLVITPEDIKKYFCFMDFHCYLLNIDEISKEEFERATENKKFFWEEYILPKYPNAVVEEIRTEARISPIPVWDPALYEDRRW